MTDEASGVDSDTRVKRAKYAPAWPTQARPHLDPKYKGAGAIPSPALKDDPAVLREYLRVYGGHIYPCPGRPCECGFQKAWEVAGLPITTHPTAAGDTNTAP